MTVRVGINGFGRIGRNFYRAARAAGADIEIVAVNDLTDNETLAHLLRYDSVYGPFPGELERGDGWMSIDGRRIADVLVVAVLPGEHQSAAHLPRRRPGNRIGRGHQVAVFDNRTRPRTAHNLSWLHACAAEAPGAHAEEVERRGGCGRTSTST